MKMNKTMKSKVLIKLITVAFFAAMLSGCNHSSTEKELADYVNPLLGTSSSRWMLFPGPCLPFGMVKLSPDNTTEGQYQLGAGYEYKINSISGFGHVHSWMMASFITMPTTGEVKILAGTVDDPDSGYRSRINNENTKASAGYYSAILEDYDIKAELTATTRGGFQRYTFPKNESAQILFDFKITEEEPSTIIGAAITKVSDTEIEGYVKREAGEWNEYTVHFVARFNRPFTSMNGWQGSDILNNTNEIKVTEDLDVGAFVKFDVSESQTILMQTAISYVSIDQARLNLVAEMDDFDWSFEAAHNNARVIWNELLGKIKVEGGTETDKLKFYTGLYRAYSSKTIYSDVNGKYVDACENIQQVNSDDFSVYGADAFWGSFWNLNQVWSLVSPDKSEKWVKSLLELYDKDGWLHDAPG
ncbi:MAG: glycoside hydrolase family 92 protein, partial [Draconibacterium sp.]|nr:glycoside hydrolase family 92 protein [Draconibacterium sp.]